MSKDFKEIYRRGRVYDFTGKYESTGPMERYYQQRKLKSIFMILRKILRERPCLILDLGAGDGTILDLANNVSTKLFPVGLELSKDHCITLREKGYNPIISDVEYIPIRSEVAEVVFFLDVIEHLRSPSRVLPDIFRILKNGGNCLISTPNKFGIYEYKELVYVGSHSIDIINMIRGRSRSNFPYHIKLYSLKELLNILESYGFHREYVTTVGFCLPFLGNIKFFAQLLSVDVFKSNMLKKVLQMLERKIQVLNFLIILLCEKNA